MKIEISDFVELIRKVVGDPSDKKNNFIYFGIAIIISAVLLFLQNNLVLDTSSPELLANGVITIALAIVGSGTLIYNLLLRGNQSPPKDEESK